MRLREYRIENKGIWIPKKELVSLLAMCKQFSLSETITLTELINLIDEYNGGKRVIRAKRKKAGESRFQEYDISQVLPTVREMGVGDIILIPIDYKEAARAAASICRTKCGLNVKSNVFAHGGEKYIKLERV